MKTDPRPQPPIRETVLALSDEVILALEGEHPERRVLVATAVLLLTQCLVAGIPSKVFSLHRDLIAQVRDGTVTGFPMFTAAVENILPAVNSLMIHVRELTLDSVREELLQGVAEPESPSENPQTSS